MAIPKPGQKNWWVKASKFPVVQLAGVEYDDLVSFLDPLPADAPAVAFCPSIDVTDVRRCILSVLEAIETAVVELFPAWLPEATGIDSPAGAGEVAVRLAAKSLAVSSAEYGPFLEDLATKGLRRQFGSPSNFPPQSRAKGLARVLARSLRRSSAVLAIEIPVQLTPAQETIVAGAARWLAEQGDLAVWLIGRQLEKIEWIPSIDLSSWTKLARHTAEEQSKAWTHERTEPVAPIQLTIVGTPKRGAESVVAKALANASWAGHHEWNQYLSLGALGPSVQPDIRWPAEHIVVEIDGPEHHGAVKYSIDRQRDALLLLNGYLVLRFTNAQVHADLAAVLHIIHSLLKIRRNSPSERQGANA